LNDEKCDNPLFLPLNVIWYTAFRDGIKKWEIRGIGNQYNKKTVRVGREVALRRGYNTKDNMGGIITSVVTTNDIWTLRKDILDEAIPIEIRELNKPWIDAYNEKYNEFIIFKIELDEASRCLKNA